MRSIGAANGSWACKAATADGRPSTPITPTITSTIFPFADHGALLDPPSPDLTARCLSMLAQLGETGENSPAVAAALDYLRRTQEADGSWYGRWGV